MTNIIYKIVCFDSVESYEMSPRLQKKAARTQGVDASSAVSDEPGPSYGQQTTGQYVFSVQTSSSAISLDDTRDSAASSATSSASRPRNASMKPTHSARAQEQSRKASSPTSSHLRAVQATTSEMKQMYQQSNGHINPLALAVPATQTAQPIQDGAGSGTPRNSARLIRHYRKPNTRVASSSNHPTPAPTSDGLGTGGRESESQLHPVNAPFPPTTFPTATAPRAPFLVRLLATLGIRRLSSRQRTLSHPPISSSSTSRPRNQAEYSRSRRFLPISTPQCHSHSSSLLTCSLKIG